MAYYKRRRGGKKKRWGFFGRKNRSSSARKAFHIGYGAGLVRNGNKDQLNNYLKGSNARSYIAGMKSAEHTKAFNFDDFMF